MSMRVTASRGMGMSRLRWPVSGSLMRRPLRRMRDCSKVVPRRDRSAWTPLGGRAWRLSEASRRRGGTPEVGGSVGWGGGCAGVGWGGGWGGGGGGFRGLLGAGGGTAEEDQREMSFHKV